MNHYIGFLWLWYSKIGVGNIFWVLRWKTATMITEVVQTSLFIITCAHSGTCTSSSATPAHKTAELSSQHCLGSQHIRLPCATSRRWHRGEFFLGMLASKIIVKYPQTHDYSTWFYLTKLLTSRPLGFPAVSLLAGTPFCLSCSAAGRKQMLSFKKTELPSGKHIPVF